MAQKKNFVAKLIQIPFLATSPNVSFFLNLILTNILPPFKQVVFDKSYESIQKILMSVSIKSSQGRNVFILTKKNLSNCFFNKGNRAKMIKNAIYGMN